MTDTERRGYNDKNKDCPVRPHGRQNAVSRPDGGNRAPPVGANVLRKE